MTIILERNPYLDIDTYGYSSLVTRSNFVMSVCIDLSRHNHHTKVVNNLTSVHKAMRSFVFSNLICYDSFSGGDRDMVAYNEAAP